MNVTIKEGFSDIPNKNNFNLTGDEARMLMLLMINSQINVPSNMAIQLWTRLNQINEVQPNE